MGRGGGPYYLCFQSVSTPVGVATCGGNSWSEPAATNAPIADEPIEAVFRMNENPILPARIYIYIYIYIYIFPTSSLPQNFPPSYLPPTNPSPPSLHRQSSKGVEREWAWSRGAARVGAGPMREPEQDPGKHLTFFSLVYFVCLWSCFVA